MIGTKIFEETSSIYNGNIKVVWSLGLGRYIQANGLTQSGGIVKSFWKQTLKKIKKNNPKIKNCLILGLGGGSLVEIIHYLWSQAAIIGVDIDKKIVGLGIKYLGLRSSDLKIVIDDASEYVHKVKSKKIYFDLIIVDLYNGDKFPKEFESKIFSESLLKILSADGTVVFNRLFYKEKKKASLEFGRKIKTVFKSVEVYFPVTNIMYICNN